MTKFDVDHGKRIEKEVEEQRQKQLEETPQGPTVLWRSAAKTVSLVTGLSSLAVRTGCSVGSFGLTIGREATQRSLGLNQTVLEMIIQAVGKDVRQRSGVAMRHEAVENLVGRWVSSLVHESIHHADAPEITSVHTGFSLASFVAATGFYVAQTAIDWTQDSSLQGLTFLNNIFGCTETSRAVAAIVTLMRKELNRPNPDGSDGNVPSFNLLLSVASFLFLQRSGRRKTEIEWRQSGGDTTVWDIVLDDKGFRADVVATKRKDLVTTSQAVTQSPTGEDSDELAVFGKELDDEIMMSTVSLSAEDQITLNDEEIKQRIIDQLPAGSRATITNESRTLKTITVDVHGSEATNIEAPPGMVMVSEHLNHNASAGHSQQTVVFRTASKVVSRADVSSQQPLRLAGDNTDMRDSVNAEPTARILAAAELTDSALSHETAVVESSSRSQNTQQDIQSSGVLSPTANQKKTRRPISEQMSLGSRDSKSSPKQKRERADREDEKNDKDENMGVIRKALKSLSPTQSTAAMNKVAPYSPRHRSNSASGFSGPFSQNLKPLTLKRDNARKPMFHVPTTQPTTPSVTPGRTTPAAVEISTNNYFAVHEQRRESTYSQTDTYSIHSNDSRPPSPSASRTQLRSSNSFSKAHSHTEISSYQDQSLRPEDGSPRHRRTRSFVPSLYSMGTKNSQEDSIVIRPKIPIPKPSIFESDEMLLALAKDGRVPGQFPRRHIVWTLQRYAKFASAAYGNRFLTFMGLSPEEREVQKSRNFVKIVNLEHNSFSLYTELPEETIVTSSFLDPQAVAHEFSGEFSALIHFVSLDFEAKAVVLTCRGTLGFGDLLTDMMCDYADMYFQGQLYQVHRGIYEAARRFVDSKDGGQILGAVREKLEEYPEFGFVLCGHSLGGAVAAVLAIMLAEPSKPAPGETDVPAFVIGKQPRLLPSNPSTSTMEHEPVILPAGRPIHVYSFGSPATVSPALRIATRGLITTVINGNDLFPCLSLGTLHDFRAVARLLRDDVQGTFTQLKDRATNRIWNSAYSFLWAGHENVQAQTGVQDRSTLAGDGLGEDQWMWNELVEMRKVMTNQKLVAPGEIFTLDSSRVFDRDPDQSTKDAAERAKSFEPGLGRPATRVQFKWVRDVEKRFNEVRFGRTMLLEHYPWQYEKALGALEMGVMEY